MPSLSEQAGPPASPGQVVWHDLVTPDPAKARSFYSGLLGWRFDGSAYSVIRNENGIVVGGMVDGRKLGKRPETALWVTSLAVSEIESAVRNLVAAGGSVRTGPAALPNRGRVALVEDPQGALVQIVETGTGARSASPTTWIWHELVTSNPKEAAQWYDSLEGVKSRSLGSYGRYELIASGRKAATISKNPFRETRNTWIPVIATRELEKKLALVDALGGRVVLAPSPQLGDGDIALILDPSGAAVILQEAKGGRP